MPANHSPEALQSAPTPSIHAPRVGCDGMSDGGVIEVKRFQFTHPVWGATTIPHKTDCLSPRFNSRTPCGVRPVNLSTSLSFALFQFTHPVWGATVFVLFVSILLSVSIHAPRVGCDTSQSTSRASTAGFNSRTPCGVRLSSSMTYAQIHNVSIHAPRVGCDSD